MAMEMEEKMKLNRTLLRAIEILELLSRSKEGYTLTELPLYLIIQSQLLLISSKH